MKFSVLIFWLIVFFVISSCKKCIEFECKKDGNVYTEKNCAYGGRASNETQQTWIKYLEEEKGYDEVNCKEVK